MISYYDLLGMIKEGNIPKKVKCDNSIFEWFDFGYYRNTRTDEYLTELLYENEMYENEMFDKKIEIIEKYNGIEKIDTESRTLTTLQLEIIHKINELVVKINELERGLNS